MPDPDPKVTEAGGAPAAAPKAPEVIMPDWSAKIAALEKDLETARTERGALKEKTTALESKWAEVFKSAPKDVKAAVESIWPWDFLFEGD